MPVGSLEPVTDEHSVTGSFVLVSGLRRLAMSDVLIAACDPTLAGSRLRSGKAQLRVVPDRWKCPGVMLGIARTVAE